ncbi:MAG: Alanine--tRNA ligase [Chloroflexota bacterium]|jgi:misacylated tRNA(Ala) deacylase|nr:alanyl-tRNA editing protein [Dehalococcoidia bacterium]MQG60930.1 alanyl-tRNA editing protein [SAR202 cluster bacterium]CAI8318221.1 MAG: Alanine--tRNA ligase [Chloroflexota bacterium]|tara:strand:+ start:3130 stop:3849 length:720 start_codon:yes stop_codon:yes gene_type:complete
MTDLLFHKDSYLQSTNATVIKIVEDNGIVLDRTVFYPGGGGQPHDLGVISIGNQNVAVTKVQNVKGEVIHWVEDNHGITTGQSVTAEIDWDRRYTLMRTHTALHILCGVVWRDYKAQVTGGDMQPGTARMDFEFENMTAEFAEQIEDTINREVNDNRTIEVNFLTREQANQVPDLIRTKINLLPEAISEIRTIDISGLDLQADGGTHVKNTSEVGFIKVTGHESKGRINKRLRIALDQS